MEMLYIQKIFTDMTNVHNIILNENKKVNTVGSQFMKINEL